MPSQRAIIGIGLAILLSISAASIGLDVKSRIDAAAVSQTLGMLRKFADIQLLLRRSESAARGFRPEQGRLLHPGISQRQ